MSLREIMINLCIGILSGAFSSIIISRFFLILSTHTEQLSRVQEHFENTYKLSGTLGFYLHLNSKIKDPTDIFTIEELSKTLLADIREKASQECDRFDSMIFDDLSEELHSLAVDLNDYMIHLSTLSAINSETAEKISKHLWNLQTRFTQYKNKSTLYLRKRIFHDPWLRVLLIIFILVLIITAIAIIAT